jgi:hypothetical protein
MRKRMVGKVANARDGWCFLFKFWPTSCTKLKFLFPLPPAKILGEVLPNKRGATNMIHDAIKQKFIGAAYLKKIRQI